MDSGIEIWSLEKDVIMWKKERESKFPDYRSHKSLNFPGGEALTFAEALRNSDGDTWKRFRMLFNHLL